MFIIAAAAGVVLATLVTLNRIVGWRSMAKNATIIDVSFSVGVGVMFIGTPTGMLVAIIAGLFMALVLNAMQVVADRTAPKEEDFTSEFTADGKWKYNEAPYV